MLFLTLNCVRAALNAIKALEDKQSQEVAFVLQLLVGNYYYP